MDKNELSTFIIHHLSEEDDPDDIILALCEKNDLSWQEAETLVKNVQVEDGQVIAKKQFPLLFMLALAIFIAGMGLIGYGLFTILSEFSIIQTNLNNIHHILSDMDAFTNLYVSMETIITTGGSPITIIILGTGMILGSLFGMRDAWSSILEQ